MPKKYSVKFRAGRGINDSEARSSAGVPHYDEDAPGHYQPRHWDVDSLPEKLGLLTSGLEKSDGDLEIHDLVTDVDHVLADIALYYSRSEIIQQDTDRLQVVLDARSSNPVRGWTYETRYLLMNLSRRLFRVVRGVQRSTPYKP
jgi:hypothetical protein